MQRWVMATLTILAVLAGVAIIETVYERGRAVVDELSNTSDEVKQLRLEVARKDKDVIALRQQVIRLGAVPVVAEPRRTRQASPHATRSPSSRPSPKPKPQPTKPATPTPSPSCVLVVCVRGGT